MCSESTEEQDERVRRMKDAESEPTKPTFDDMKFVETKFGAYIPIEEFKDGWTLPEFEENNPAHAALAEHLARIVDAILTSEAAARPAEQATPPAESAPGPRQRRTPRRSRS